MPLCGLVRIKLEIVLREMITTNNKPVLPGSEDGHETVVMRKAGHQADECDLHRKGACIGIVIDPGHRQDQDRSWVRCP